MIHGMIEARRDHLKVFRTACLRFGLILWVLISCVPFDTGGGMIPVARCAQRHPPQKVDASAQILEYYRKYPDRYVRISDESWQYSEKSRVAYHSFTLRNSATIPYSAIEVRISYQTPSGKELKAELVKVEGVLPALGRLAVRELKVKQVPPAAKIIMTVAAAAIH